MNSIISDLYQQLLAALQNNQFLSGGAGLMLLGAIGYTLRRIPTQLWNLFLRYCTVIVDVQSNDDAYNWILLWLNHQAYGESARRVTIKHIADKYDTSHVILVPARGYHWFLYKGRPLWLIREKEENKGPAQNESLRSMLNPTETISLRIVGRGRYLINQIIEEARVFQTRLETEHLVIKRFQWGSWCQVYKEKRPMASIMLPTSADGLMDDVRTFIAKKDWYQQMGIPHRRGYLFFGPPGTGKSSTAEALAGELNIPIYALNLAGMTDQSLEGALANMNGEKAAILLVEDIDTIVPTRETGKDQKICLGTLLNAIDGVLASEGRILIMTTNFPDKIDPALKRRGRIDREVEFGMATEAQIHQALYRFIPLPTPEQLRLVTEWLRPISMADVQEHLKQMVLGQGREEK